MIRALVQEEIGAKIKVEEKDVREYFDAHPEEFSGDTVHLRHIVVASEGEAREIQARLAKNESFEELAKKVSRDTNSGPKGGDLGSLGREQMLPDFAKAAFALKVNEVSDVVRTPFGFHLVKLVNRKKGQPLAFEQVKAQLQRRLLDERQAQRFQAWVKELEGGAKITREESLLPVGKVGSPTPSAPAAPAEEPKAEGKS
jgi:parvulin-like peptidyl-prolyl isomerase